MVEITLFGFGDDCPQGFVNNKRRLDLDQNEGIEGVLKMAGFDNLQGLVLLVNNQGIVQEKWDRTVIAPGDSIKILSAIEGG